MRITLKNNYTLYYIDVVKFPIPNGYINILAILPHYCHMATVMYELYCLNIMRKYSV
jgi:hypothetical protein